MMHSSSPPESATKYLRIVQTRLNAKGQMHLYDPFFVAVISNVTATNGWLINSHNGINGKLERIHIEDYPAVKAHLDQYWDKISTRADKGDTPYNLRNCAYLDFFSPTLSVSEKL